MEQVIRVEARAAYRVITLNRPERMNALDPATLHGLLAALADAEADPACRALVLTGEGRAFCAGADLASLTPGADVGDAIERTWNPLARRLAALRMPTIAAVNGVAAGAGASFALGCDIVLAAQSARFVIAFAKIGLIPDCGATWLLPRIVGAARARAMAMLAEPIDAARAEAWGMVWRVVEDASLRAEAERLAAHLAAQPTHALTLTRALMAASAASTLDAQLDRERDGQRDAGRTDDFREGVAAFLEKRAPRFTGAAP